MEDLNDTWYTYLAEVNALFTEEEEPLPLTNYIENIELHYHYHRDIFPYIAVDLILPKSIHLKLQKNDEDVLFSFKIIRFDSLGKEEIPFEHDIYENIIFKASDIPASILEESDDEEPQESPNIREEIPEHEMQLFLFSFPAFHTGEVRLFLTSPIFFL